MADDAQAVQSAPKKCPPCKPGLPGWMATFSDLVTLLLTFFVLLLSFAKTETAKYEAALGSLRDAFGGNVMNQGEVIQPGKSPEDSPTMFESQQPIKPFPIDVLTTEGFLDKHEINRESAEDLRTMKSDLEEYNLSGNVQVQEIPEGVQVIVDDKIFFREGSLEPEALSAEVYDRLIQLLSNKEWTIFVQGHASRGESSSDGTRDAYELSAARATAVSRSLIRRGVKAEVITTVSYGDSRPFESSGLSFEEQQRQSRRVEFLIRKVDLSIQGKRSYTN
jgi:chemotaxis protein MotB